MRPLAWVQSSLGLLMLRSSCASNGTSMQGRLSSQVWSGARQDGTDQEAARGELAEEDEEQDQHDDTDNGDGRVLAAEIGSRTFLDRLRDLLHARRAGIRRHDARGCVDAVQHGDNAAADDGPKDGRHSG